MNKILFVLSLLVATVSAQAAQKPDSAAMQYCKSALADRTAFANAVIDRNRVGEKTRVDVMRAEMRKEVVVHGITLLVKAEAILEGIESERKVAARSEADVQEAKDAIYLIVAEYCASSKWFGKVEL